MTLLSNAPTHLKCESLTNLIGIGTSTPSFSWRVNGSGRGVRQSAYRANWSV
ncbi:glycoside hydrolase family 78 protein [Paenibacillus koleovorans]|uniref:glycoside hydrolase family 78 protein n=1 Tax=Paenibacillus koleovorans TaxID=121608 RepID=UPI00403B0407